MTWRREAGLSDVLYRDQGIGYSSIMLPVTMFVKSSLFRNEFLLMTNISDCLTKALELADWNNVGMRMKGYAPIWPYNSL